MQVANMTSIKKIQKQKKAFSSDLMSEVIIEVTPSTSFSPIYKSPQKNSYDSDLSDLGFYWPKSEENIRQQLLARKSLFSPVFLFKRKDEAYYACWPAIAVVTLKTLSMGLSCIINTSIEDKCYHLKDCSGVKEVIKKAGSEILEYKHVVKADTADFYIAMNQQILLKHYKQIIKDKKIIRILYQYINHSVGLAREYKFITQEISISWSLSPLMGALILLPLDKVVNIRFIHVRYKYGWLILAKARSYLCNIVKKTHQVIEKVKFKFALGKTYRGKTPKGFEFLGYRFNDKGLIGLASKTINNFKELAMKLYEQGANAPRIHCYIRRRIAWATVV